MKEHDQIYTNI